jgi:hypothetical protein
MPWTDIATGQSRWTGFNSNFGSRDYTSIPLPGSGSSKKNLDDLHQTFATALASTNPEEDFVEAYSFAALMKSSCQNCTFKYDITSSDSVQLNDERGSNSLHGKFGCANSVVGLSSRWGRSRPR